MPVPTLMRGHDTSALRRHCVQRMALLDTARAPWLAYCRTVAEHLIPNRLPYLLNPHGNERAGEQNDKICDAVGHLSLSTASSGVTIGTMPPASTWFGLSVRNEWGSYESDTFLEEAARRMLDMHNQANTNHVMPERNEEYLAFGTGAVLITEDDEDAFRLDPMSVGEYWIADDARGRVDTLYRKLTMTVSQLADEFGLDNVSSTTRSAYDRGDYDQPVPCVQAIEPDRDRRNPIASSALPWRSVYYEESSDQSQVLAVRGYRKFPALVWRFGKLPGSAYGYGLGHEVLPHLVRLRSLIYRYGNGMALQSEPPVTIPPGMAQHEVKVLPGAKWVSFGQQKVESNYQVPLRLDHLAEEIERTRNDIRETLGATLVASLRRLTQTMTATEAEIRRSQDLTEWMPSLFRMNEELLNPYIEWMWEIAMSRGLLPPIPPELADQTIDIEFTSPLALKQRQGEVEAIVRTAAILGEMAKVKPDVVDNFDFDEAIRRVSKIQGSPTATLVPLEQVRAMREARAQEQQAAKVAAAAQASVDVAKGVAETESLAGAA